MKSPNASQAKLSPCIEHFVWDAYLDACGTQPALGDDLFPHHKFANSTLSEIVFKAGTTVFVQKTSQANPRQAIVETAVVDKIFVRYTENNDREFVDLEHILEESVAKCLLRKRDLNLAHFSHEHRESMNVKVKDLIKIGQYFELQDQHDPRMVSIVEIIENHSGLIIYENTQNDRLVGCIHIANERCHAIGWARQGHQVGVCYHQDDLSLLDKARENAVMAPIFEHNPVPRHTVKVGQTVEVVDPFGKGLIYPGYVCALVNDHYFRVAVCTQDLDNDYEMTVHAAHPFVLQPGWSKVHGLRLSVPEGFAPIGSGLSSEFNWFSFQKVFQLMEPIDEDAMTYPITSKDPPESMRHLEVFNPQNGIIGTAIIVRAVKHLLWLSFDHSPVQQPPTIFAVNSEQLFPCNFARDHKLPFLEPPIFKALPLLKDGEIRFGKDKLFTTIPTTVFNAPKLPYLPECYVKCDYLLPIVYVNTVCNQGPFLRADRIARLPKQYGPGTMIQIIKLIFRDLFGCFHYVSDFFKLFDWAEKTNLPTMYAKKERRKNRLSEMARVLHVPRCESARAFAGWMRIVLRVLQACPSLFSLEENVITCPERCGGPTNHKTKGSIPALGPVAPLPPREVQTRSQTAEKREPKKELKRFLPQKPVNSTKISITNVPPVKKQRPLREASLAGQKPSTSQPVVTKTEEPRPIRTVVKPQNKPVEDEQTPVKMILCPPVVSPDDSPKETTKDQKPSTSTLPPETVTSPAPSTSSTVHSFPLLHSNPSTWDPIQLQSHLESSGVNGDLIKFLDEHQINGESFLKLSVDSIMEKGLKFGPALVIEGEVKKLKSASEKQFLQ